MFSSHWGKIKESWRVENKLKDFQITVYKVWVAPYRGGAEFHRCATGRASSEPQEEATKQEMIQVRLPNKREKMFALISGVYNLACVWG